MAKFIKWAIAVVSIVLLAAGMALATTYLPKLPISTKTAETPTQPEPTPPASAPTPTPTPTPAPAPAPVVTAVTNSFVRLRAAKSTSSAILAELQGGTTVTLLDEVDELWQQVKYNDITGYIYKSYLTY